MTNIFSALDLKFFNSLFFDPWFILLVLLFVFILDFYSCNIYSLFGLFINFFNGLSLLVYGPFLFFSYIVFVFFFFFNLSGLFPYFFGVSSHLFANLLVSVFVYFNIVFFGLYKDVVSYFSHFVPLGSGSLSFFLFFVEFLSFWIRIITLTLRLSVNMTAGHVFLHLFGSSFSSSFNIFLLLLVVFYMFFEVFVCVIQASVYCLLINSYVCD
uniref:ATP synthase subunit a n=1 Tax=Schmidtea mediterranea TaxID=79327 RepID=T1PTK3_SCHMD|nr:ATP synthase F0 subunit 6 [Schmidtea mediterranea]AFQ93453.1 ATP synthase F0 subunit 6 [Schmidtea mediterranea]